jgi:plasmid stabilization system protein ParE
MTRALIVRRRAEAHAASARNWYNEQRPGLGDAFVEELGAAIERAHQNPLHYQMIYRDIRRVLLRRFPYAVFYVAEKARVVVLAVLRQSEDPQKWRQLK